MRAPTSVAAPAAALFAACVVAAFAAGAQEPERQIRREVVVVGGHPSHHPMVLDRLASRGFLGVQLLGLTPELRRHLGAPPESGVLVSRLTADGPAAAAGVRVGDVITAIDGEPVRTTSHLVGRVGRQRQGDEVELSLIREGAALTLRATLAQTERRQLEIGQFLWRGDAAEPMVIQLDPDAEVERLIAVDPEAISESVGQLLERLEGREARGLLRLDDERRRQLEERIAELEARLRALEREIERRRAPPRE